MIQDERVSKLVTEILELKDWNNWSAIPWNYERREGGTCHIICGDTISTSDSPQET